MAAKNRNAPAECCRSFRHLPTAVRCGHTEDIPDPQRRQSPLWNPRVGEARKCPRLGQDRKRHISAANMRCAKLFSSSEKNLSSAFRIELRCKSGTPGCLFMVTEPGVRQKLPSRKQGLWVISGKRFCPTLQVAGRHGATTNQRLALQSACATIFLRIFCSPPCARARGGPVFRPWVGLGCGVSYPDVGSHDHPGHQGSLRRLRGIGRRRFLCGLGVARRCGAAWDRDKGRESYGIVSPAARAEIGAR